MSTVDVYKLVSERIMRKRNACNCKSTSSAGPLALAKGPVDGFWTFSAEEAALASPGSHQPGQA
ncbi:unnamed protein product [Prunus armeniaca]